MHLAGVHARVSEFVVFSNWQCVDVRAQTDRAAAAAVLEDADHPGYAHAPMHWDAPIGKGACDQIRGAPLLEAKFWVSVNIAPQCRERRRIGWIEFGPRGVAHWRFDLVHHVSEPAIA